jgi:hydrogenase small subunit
MKWNGGVSWPIESGHPCLGCSEPDFWDAGGFYRALSVPIGDSSDVLLGAGAAGIAVGAAAGLLSRRKTAAAKATHQPVTAEELEQKL